MIELDYIEAAKRYVESLGHSFFILEQLEKESDFTWKIRYRNEENNLCATWCSLKDLLELRKNIPHKAPCTNYYNQHGK